MAKKNKLSVLSGSYQVNNSNNYSVLCYDVSSEKVNVYYVDENIKSKVIEKRNTRGIGKKENKVDSEKSFEINFRSVEPMRRRPTHKKNRNRRGSHVDKKSLLLQIKEQLSQSPVLLSFSALYGCLGRSIIAPSLVHIALTATCGECGPVVTFPIFNFYSYSVVGGTLQFCITFH